MMRTKLFLLTVLCCFGFTGIQGQIIPKEENSLRMMCYNVRNCKGMDDQTDCQRVADVINRVSPDVVAVQELDSATERSNGIFVLKELAERTLMHWTYAPAIDYQGGKYGVGILSKEKPLNYHTLPLPGREEARTLLIAEFKEYVLCCTHFSLTEADREASVPVILDAVKDIGKPLFLAGDMNSNPGSPTQEAIRKNFIPFNDTQIPTSPSVGAKNCIDYIYGYKNGSTCSVLQRRVLSDEQMASDHLPLFVDVRMPKDVSAIFRTKPYLQNPTNKGMTVSWFTHVPVHSWIEYGTDQSLAQQKELLVDGQVICNNTHHKIRLGDLKPGTTYYYRVCSREITRYEAYKKEFGHTAYSDIYSFTTPAVDASDFTAVILNDLHKNKQVVDLLTDQLPGVSCDFVLFNGDCIDDPKNETEVIDFLSYINEKVKAAEKPVFFLRGNHEIRNAYSIQLRSFFDYVGDKTYGAFNWGDTRFVMLDCGEDKPDTTSVYYGLNDFTQLRKEQVHFLQQELKDEAFKKANRRILVHHIPLYGMPDKAYCPCLELWGGLLKKAPFDLCINAHMHRYAYHPGGTQGNPFPVVIGGGNKPENATILLLQKKGKALTLTVRNAKGEIVKHVEL